MSSEPWWENKRWLWSGQHDHGVYDFTGGGSVTRERSGEWSCFGLGGPFLGRKPSRELAMAHVEAEAARRTALGLAEIVKP